jgi:hypothetical protein
LTHKISIIGVLAACFVAASAVLGGGAAQAAPLTDSSSNIAASEAAAAKASPAGDKAALDAAKEFSASSLLYCTDRYAYFTPSNSVYTYIPDFESATRDTNVCYLEQGTSGLAVRTLQTSLKQCYGKSITVDGQFGPATYNALLQVQRSVGVTIDGVYGPGTGKAMKHGGTTCRKVPSALFS